MGRCGPRSIRRDRGPRRINTTRKEPDLKRSDRVCIVQPANEPAEP